MNVSRFVTLTALLVGSACTVQLAGPEPIDPATATTTSTTGVTTTPSSTTTSSTLPPTATTTLPQAPLGLVSPSGVPVAILATNGLLHTVLTPCGREAPLVLGTPLHRTTVVIDPGHGGPVDTGAWGPNGLREKDLNLEVARAVETLLVQRGISVVLTRTGDYPSRLFVRSNLADTLGAELMVSIHHNSPPPATSSQPGTEVFIQEGSADSARLGGLLWERVTKAFSILDVSWARAPDAGVMTVVNTNGADAYGMLRYPETTSVLIELGYISNPSEAALFASDIYPFYAANAIVSGIEDYLGTDKPGDGFRIGRTFNPQPGISSDACVDPDLG